MQTVSELLSGSPARHVSSSLLALCLHAAFCILHSGAPAEAQQLIDRVLARIGTTAVTMTDVRAAIELGIVDVKPGEDPESAALQRLIDRQLQLKEVARFSPPDPPAAEVAKELAAMKANAGSRLTEVMTSTGLDDEKLQLLARETLRIRAYVRQRFANNAQVTEDEARKYFDEHPGEFTHDGMRLSFEEAAADARRRASDERFRATLDQWTRDLRMRAEVNIIESGTTGR
jgi:hypothetical protein